jgi:hypothetical protein
MRRHDTGAGQVLQQVRQVAIKCVCAFPVENAKIIVLLYNQPGARYKMRREVRLRRLVGAGDKADNRFYTRLTEE